MVNIYGVTYDKLREILVREGEKPSRASVILPALYRDGAEDISSLPVSDTLKEKLEGLFYARLPECVEIKSSQTADKLLFRLSDGSLIETVLMKHGFGNKICVSTQVGCSMGCAFCHSGRIKKLRNLTAAELVGQVLYIKRKLCSDIGGIAVMGIGEPLENLEALTDFVDIITYQNGLDIAMRRITVSTCGLADKIHALYETGRRVNLAVSLHAPDNELRNRLMPINRKHDINTVIDAAKFYSRALNRKVTLEYVMLAGVNDSRDQAARLAELVGDSKLYVNLIRYNPSEGMDFKCSGDEAILAFYDVLKKRGVSVTVRRSLGADVSAACGQLAGRHPGKEQ